MRAFSYIRAQEPSDAVACFRPGTAYLGGGTNLVDLMRLGVAAPDQLVDVSGLGAAAGREAGVRRQLFDAAQVSG